jgi:hypothetical protein
VRKFTSGALWRPEFELGALFGLLTDRDLFTTSRSDSSEWTPDKSSVSSESSKSSYDFFVFLARRDTREGLASSPLDMGNPEIRVASPACVACLVVRLDDEGLTLCRPNRDDNLSGTTKSSLPLDPDAESSSGSCDTTSSSSNSLLSSTSALPAASQDDEDDDELSDRI